MDAMEMDNTFPSIPTTCLLVFRCLVLGADSACVDTAGVPIFTTFSKHFGPIFTVPWVLLEVILIFGVLNLVTAAFVMQAQDNKAKSEFLTAQLRQRTDEMMMDKLDYMLRNLLHPKRKVENEKLRNASAIIDLIQARHPEVARKIEDFPQKMTAFAKEIPESVAKYEQAFSLYKFKEADGIRELE